VAGPLGPVRVRGGVAGRLGPVWTPWGRGLSSWPRVAVLEAWPVPYASWGHRGGVAGPLCPVGGPWGRGWPLGPLCHRGSVAVLLGSVWLPWGRGRSPGARVAAVGAWPVFWAP